jgi:hypothetical protein
VVGGAGVKGRGRPQPNLIFLRNKSDRGVYASFSHGIGIQDCFFSCQNIYF